MTEGVAIQPVRTKGSPLTIGVTVWLASEMMFFAGLFAAFFVLSANNDPWPPAGSELDSFRASIFTVVFIVSGACMWVAVQTARRGDRTAMLLWLLLTTVLGVILVAAQLLEWLGLDFSISSNPFGSMYYLLTGIHVLHVVAGIVLLVAVAFMVGGRRTRAPVGHTVQVASYYWFFLVIMWIAVFLVLYVLQ
ncbi:MAG: putative cytochrome c oxidase subunit 3 [Acidimicrobiales bacterium]|nr:MAG: cytochrome B [Actinomycetota bacterium]MBV6507404.1 putative cytochrome c oxidase subunit 3 [Acidimicrobiales bacterium]RIK07791.1 MAG: cytochrome B [Acidobacteriota bacterium]